MKALSIRQPWAWAILNGKPVENRDWYTGVRGPVLMHAGKKFDNSAVDFIERLLGKEIPKDLPLGGIVGRFYLYNCVKYFDSPWFFGKYGFLLRNAVELPFTPLRGQLGFFEVSEWMEKL